MFPVDLEMERRHMWQVKLNSEKLQGAILTKLAVAAILVAGCLAGDCLGQQPGQKTFASAEEASNALVTALQNNKVQAILDVLGPDGKQIASSGDETEDANSHANFVQCYREMHRLVQEPDGTTVLYIGAKNWPTPIPLVNKDKVWFF